MARPKKKIEANKTWKFEAVFPKIGAYSYCWRPLDNKYPLERFIRSWAWVDELVVVNAAKDDEDDGTKALLEQLAKEFPNLTVHSMPNSPVDNALFDGENKAIARALCMSPILISADVDELCPSACVQQFRELAKRMPDDILGYDLPVYESLGEHGNFRTAKTFNPSKWRMTWNNPQITHGLPDFDIQEVNGKRYSKGMTDGAFYIDAVSNKLVGLSFPEVDSQPWMNENLLYLRNAEKLGDYQAKLERIFDRLPFVYHVGHVDLRKKIDLYLKTWHSHWNKLSNKDPNDPNNNRYFSGTKPEAVTEQMIDEKIVELRQSEKILQVASAINKIKEFFDI